MAMTRIRLTSVRARVDRTTPIFCPTCGGDRLGDVCDGRRRIALGPIAVLPWTRREGHVRCTACDSHHPTECLDALTSAELADRLVDVTRILTVTTVRAGDPSDRAMRRRAVQHVRTVIPGYHQNRLDADMVALDPASVAVHVTPLADALEVAGKERLIANMVQVALAAHTISSHQRWLLDRVGTSLGLTPMHVTGIISAVASAVEPIAEDPADRP
ncbi:hypothetical protein ACE2AJ_15600 [Aquihabitans daechungensis]|uniref:hypothetical protein n=1 Tax=Aquihabitans daechungensis TaxID=1052257 RepID=UPI003B9EF20A